MNHVQNSSSGLGTVDNHENKKVMFSVSGIVFLAFTIDVFSTFRSSWIV